MDTRIGGETMRRTRMQKGEARERLYRAEYVAYNAVLAHGRLAYDARKTAFAMRGFAQQAQRRKG